MDAAEQTTLGSGTLVDHFKVVRLVGRGGMGEVYLARDTKLGRKVALKLVHPAALGDEDAVKRFLHEARTTAKFSHPHIVQIHAVSEHRGRPVVALEFLEGETLRVRMGDRRPSPKETIRIGLAIAEALAEAHRHGVLHRDLKPENVVIPSDGRLRVVDFGLAKTFFEAETPSVAQAEQLAAFGTAATIHETFGSQGRLLGTPLYMAPELWSGEESTGAVDVWALGLILYELLAGEHPFQGLAYDKKLYALAAKICGNAPVPALKAAEGAPAKLQELVDECLEKDPSDRPSADDLVEQLGALLHRDRISLSDEQSPFRGLLPFTEEHADLFFGRDAEVAQFLERLRHEPVLPVVGPSGAGKSSFVQAGVIPRLLEQDRWHVLKLRPGRQPFDTLAARLLRSDSEDATLPVGRRRSKASAPASRGSDDQREEGLGRRLQESPTLLCLELTRLAEQRAAPVLLFVDQLEELYSLVDDETVRRSFMDAVCRAADDPDGPVRVVLTLRDDFLGRMAEGDAARAALSRVTALRSPGPELLTEIVQKPVEAAGYDYDDPELVSAMVKAVQGEPAALPLLQFTGQVLWERRDTENKKLLTRVYEQVGGVEGALAKQADGVLNGLSSEQQHTARKLLLRLATPEGTRRVVPRGELVEGLGEYAATVLERLVQERTLVVRKGESGADADVELVHESLLRTWRRLARWIEESREELAFVAELSQAAKLWEKRGRPESEVWQGDALRIAHQRAAAVPSLPALASEFLRTGTGLERRRVFRRRLVLAGAFLALCVVAVVLLVMNQAANRQRALAEERGAEAARKHREADGSRATLLMEGAKAALEQGNMLEARAKVRASLAIEDSLKARGLWMRVSQRAEQWSRRLPSPSRRVRWLADGRTLATFVAETRTAELRDPRNGHVTREISACPTTFDISTKRGQVACGHAEGGVALRNLKTLEVEHVLPADIRGRVSLHPIRYSADGGLVATVGGSNNVVRLWSTHTGKQAAALQGQHGAVNAIAFDRYGDRVFTGGADGVVRVWKTLDGHEERTLGKHDAPVRALAVSPNGALVLSGDASGRALLWRHETGKVEREWMSHRGVVRAVDIGPHAKRLASAGDDGVARLWDAATGTLLGEYIADPNEAWVVAFSGDGAQLVTAGASGTLRLWSLRNPTPLNPPRTEPSSPTIGGVAFSPDGSVVASGASIGRGDIHLWSVSSGQSLGVWRGHETGVFSLAFSPDGQLLASGGEDKTVKLWDVAAGRLVRTLEGHGAGIREVAFAPNGRLIASASKDGSVRLWDRETGNVVNVLKGHSGAVFSVSFDADGKRLATGGLDQSVRIWDVQSGKEQRQLRGHAAGVYAVRFRGDAQQLATGDLAGAVRLWDPTRGTGEVLYEPSGSQEMVRELAYDPREALLLVAHYPRAAKLWDLRERRPIANLAWSSAIARYSADGRSFALAGNSFWLYRAEDRAPAWFTSVVLRRPPRVLTHRGWEDLGGSSQGVAMPDTKWRRRAEQSAIRAMSTPDNALLCVVTRDGALEIWDIAEDVRLLRSAGAEGVRSATSGYISLAAVPGACLVWEGSGLRLYRPAEATAVLADESRSVFNVSTESIFVSTKEGVREYDFSGHLIHSLSLGGEDSIVLRRGTDLVVGGLGNPLEVVSGDSGARVERRALDRSPDSPVTYLRDGPAGTILAAYFHGYIALLDPSDGEPLAGVRVYGLPDYFFVQDGEVFIAAVQGDHVRWDVSALSRPHCDLLREVWQQVPVTWQQGNAEIAPPPEDHECSPK